MLNHKVFTYMTKQELKDIVLKAKEEKRSLTEEEKTLINSEIEARQKPQAEEPKAEPEVKDEPKVEEPKVEDEPKVEEPKAEEERNKTNTINSSIKMEKRYNFLKELRNAYESGKKVVLNSETRAYTVTDEGEDIVQTDIYDIWMPLRQKNVLTEAGAKLITGIKNNVQIPLMGKVSCAFAGETAAAEDGSGAFSKKVLTPKRITAKYPISLQLLAQDSIGVENAVRQEIANALYSKLEETLLGSASGNTEVPAGIFNGVTPTTVTAFSGITELEAGLETNNVEGNIKYILSPLAKAGLRNMPKSSKSTELVMQNGEIDGTPAISTSNISGKKFVVGDFSNMVIATWDNVEIDVVRDVASVGNGVVTIVVNAFADGAIVRPEGFKFGQLA